MTQVNQLKTLLLLAVLTALLLAMGQLFGGRSGMIFALGFALLLNFGTYWFSDKIVLRMYNAQEIHEGDARELFRIVSDLAQRSNLPMPRVYIIPEEAPNAFATGRNPEHGAVAVTEGLLRLVDREELRGVLAHELGHLKNRDTLIMAVAATIAGALGHLANMAMWGMFSRGSDEDNAPNPLLAIVGMIVAPIAAMLIQMAISRSREFMADEAAAYVTGNPMALASALRKLESWKAELPMHAGSPATAHLFIVNPFTGKGLASLFSTHPSTEARIERLQNLAYGRVLQPA